MLFIAIGLALIVGVTLGLFGGGGAVLAVPIFVYILGVPVESAVPMSFLVIGTASGVGAIDRWRTGRLDPRRGVLFGLAAVVGAPIGARIGLLLPPAVRLSLFGAAVVLAAVSMLSSAHRDEASRAERPTLLGVLVFGAIGAFTGIVGVGGGFLFVPALVALVGVRMIDATGLSLMVVSMNALSAFAGSLGKVAIDWKLAMVFTLAVVAAMIPAGSLAPRVPVPILKRSFAVVLLAVGTYVFIDNIR